MSLFLSSFINKIDKKGRISIPSQFRAVLAQDSFAGIIIYPSFINSCIESCSYSRLVKISELIDNLDPYSSDRDAFATAILGGSIQLGFDAEGRVTIPTEIFAECGIKDSACFVGKGQTFEIWNPDAYREYFTRSRELAKNNRAMLSANGGLK
jgi:MraZ protein